MSPPPPPPSSNPRRLQRQRRRQPQQEQDQGRWRRRPDDLQGGDGTTRMMRGRRGRRPWLLFPLVVLLGLLLLLGLLGAATSFSLVETSRVRRRRRRHPLQHQHPPPPCQVPRRRCGHRSSLSRGWLTSSSPSSSSSSSSWSSSEAVPTRDDGKSIDDINQDGNEDDSTQRQHQQQQPDEEEMALQWNLFVRHHVGRWNGLWTTVNDMTDVIDETTARTVLELVTTGDDEGDDHNSVYVAHTHEVPVVSTASDCESCLDNPEVETQTLQVATHRPNTLLEASKIRLASRAVVVGPKVLPSTGLVALEVGVRYHNSRARATIVMAPAWEPGVEPMSCLPQALKVARVTLHREVLDSDGGYHPTPTLEEAHFATLPPEEASSVAVRFHRGVPPFAWHRDWHGTSWTWGPQTKDRGWQIEALELDDQWHGNNPVERWNWRSNSVFVQLPKLVTNDETALFRLAWLADPHHLLRVEAGITALRPVFDDNNDEIVVGLEPPKLVSLRCDALQCDDGNDEFSSRS